VAHAVLPGAGSVFKIDFWTLGKPWVASRKRLIILDFIAIMGKLTQSTGKPKVQFAGILLASQSSKCIKFYKQAAMNITGLVNTGLFRSAHTCIIHDLFVNSISLNAERRSTDHDRSGAVPGDILDRIVEEFVNPTFFLNGDSCKGNLCSILNMVENKRQFTKSSNPTPELPSFRDQRPYEMEVMAGRNPRQIIRLL
jgi:hypothetical protein